MTLKHSISFKHKQDNILIQLLERDMLENALLRGQIQESMAVPKLNYIIKLMKLFLKTYN